MSVDIPTEHTQKDILSKKEGEEKERESEARAYRQFQT